MAALAILLQALFLAGDIARRQPGFRDLLPPTSGDDRAHPAPPPPPPPPPPMGRADVPEGPKGRA